MAVKINGTNNTIDMGGGSLVNNSNINGLIVPDESGSFITSERADSHIVPQISTSLIKGDVKIDNETSQVGFSAMLYTGNGSTLPVVNNVDMDTQWGNDVSKRNGGLVICKAITATAAANWVFCDTVRGVAKTIYSNLNNIEDAGSQTVTSFNNNGFTLGNKDNSNTSGVSYLSLNFQTTHRRSGMTNHGQAYTEHYNPYTGFYIIKYTGSGAVGHLIPNSINRPTSFAMWKNLGTTDNWICEGSTLGIGSYFTTPGTANVTVLGEAITFDAGGNNLMTTNGATNANSNNYVVYGWCDSYLDSSNKLIGNFETGLYKGTGSNQIIKTRAKPALIMIRSLDQNNTNSMTLVDIARSNMYRLYMESANVVGDVAATVTITNDGFYPLLNTGTNNLLGINYIYLIVYDNDNGSGKSKYTKPLDNASINVNNALMPLSSGSDINGSKNKVISKNEVIPGLVYKPGKNYVYFNNLGSPTVTTEAPNYNTYSGFGDYYSYDRNSWYKNISVFKDDFSNGIGTWIADEALNNANIASVITINNELRIVNNGAYYGGARNTFPTVVGKKYRVTVNLKTVTNSSTFSCNVVIGTSPRGTNNLNFTNLNINLGRAYVYTATFIATSTTTHIMLYNPNNVSFISTWDSVCVFPILEDGSPDLSTATEILDGRNYMNRVYHADHNGQITHIEELPKTTYLNSTVINNLESVKGNAVTNSTTDNTPGKLLRVGDFGIGGSGVYKQGINLNDLKDTGWYCVNGNCLNNPTGANGWLQVVGVFGNGMMQIFTQVAAVASDRNRVFVRNYVNLNYFSPWQEQAAFEHGSFTPEVVGGSTIGVSTHGVQLGQYTKIGRWVHFSLYVVITATTGVGELVIRGLPYASDNASNYYACTLAYADQLAYTGTPSAYIYPSASYIVFRQSSPNTEIQSIPIDTNFGIMVSGSYKTASL